MKCPECKVFESIDGGMCQMCADLWLTPPGAAGLMYFVSKEGALNAQGSVSVEGTDRPADPGPLVWPFDGGVHPMIDVGYSTYSGMDVQPILGDRIEANIKLYFRGIEIVIPNGLGDFPVTSGCGRLAGTMRIEEMEGGRRFITAMRVQTPIDPHAVSVYVGVIDPARTELIGEFDPVTGKKISFGPELDAIAEKLGRLTSSRGNDPQPIIVKE